MDENVDEALVSGYEHLIGELTLPDPKDHHVLAAAIHGAEIERFLSLPPARPGAKPLG
jgi:hypothetical protein